MSLPSVIASAARQPRAAPAALDCFVALLLAMTQVQEVFTSWALAQPIRFASDAVASQPPQPLL